MERVLVVDDEEGIREFIAEVLEGEDLLVTTAIDGLEAIECLKRHTFHLLITDLKMPRLDGMGLLRKVRKDQPDMEVIVLTAHGTVDTAVEAMKLGAFDFLTKPLGSLAELRLLSRRALDHRRLKQESEGQAVLGGIDAFIVHDPAMIELRRQLKKVAITNSTVLLTGESGTGKEVSARAIHTWSPRAKRPFVAVNCAALSEQLLESEMFGHEKGAYTGATSLRKGRFELADGGTLFLDEVAEMKPSLQVKLLRVLQERSFERVGGNQTIEVNVRIIAATNRDLKIEMAQGRFREDLYHRLAVFPLTLLPLRERPGDIVPLAEHLLGKVGKSLKRPKLSLTKEAAAILQGHSWPGNVRELANVLERAAILCDTQRVQAIDLGIVPEATENLSTPGIAFDGSLKEVEREAIRLALASEGGHRKRAAARLGIGLRTLYDKIKEYGLS